MTYRLILLKLKTISLLQSPTGTVPPQALPLTLDTLAAQLADVVTHFGLKEILGLGVGVGGHVLIRFAASHPKALAGLILLSPACRQSSWWEWAAGSLTARQLQHLGWTYVVSVSLPR